MKILNKTHLFLLLSVVIFSLNVKADSISFNVLTLNTWMIPIQGKLPNERAKLIGENISDFDLVFLQEAFTRKGRKIIKKNASQKFTGQYIYQTGNILGSGLYNLSKFKVLKKKFMPFFNCRSIQCAASKGVLYTQVKLPNGFIVDTFNTHLQAYQKDARIRVKQLKQTMKFINSVNNGTHPILFVGDFNIVASTNEYSVLNNYLIGYTDTWLDFRASDAGFTWNPDINNWAKYDENESVQKQRIDYILVKDGKNLKWNVIGTEVIFNHSYRSQSGPMFVSDHFGVSSSLELGN